MSKGIKQISLLAWKFRFFVWVGFVFFVFSCSSTKYIKDTKIEDTETNREIIDRMFEFREAFEHRDSTKLLSMVSRSYYADAGTFGNASDDYKFDVLKAYLEQNLSRIKDMKYNFTIKEVYPAQKNLPKGQLPTRMIVNLKYTVSLEIITNLGEMWQRKTGEKQFELQKEQGKWMFLTGY